MRDAGLRAWSVGSRIAVGVLIGVLVATGVSEVLIYRGRQTGLASTDLAATVLHRSGSEVDIRVSFDAGPGVSDVRLVAFPVQDGPVPRTVSVLDDPAYDVLGADRHTVRGAFDHMQVELGLHGYPRPVREVTVPALVALMGDLDHAAHNMVVITTGVFPAEIFSRHADLVRPWLQAGGMLVWGGPAIGYYSGHRDTPVTITDPDNLRDNGPGVLLGLGGIETNPVAGRLGSTPTVMGAALSLDFRQTDVGVSTLLQATAGARLLGWVEGQHSSITEIPVGKGSVLVFGGVIFDELTFARDMTRLILSGALQATDAVSTKDVQTGGGTSTVDWQLPFAQTSLSVVALDPSTEGVFLQRATVRT